MALQIHQPLTDTDNEALKPCYSNPKSPQMDPKMIKIMLAKVLHILRSCSNCVVPPFEAKGNVEWLSKATTGINPYVSTNGSKDGAAMLSKFGAHSKEL